MRRSTKCQTSLQHRLPFPSLPNTVETSKGLGQSPAHRPKHWIRTMKYGKGPKRAETCMDLHTDSYGPNDSSSCVNCVDWMILKDDMKFHSQFPNSVIIEIYHREIYDISRIVSWVRPGAQHSEGQNHETVLESWLGLARWLYRPSGQSFLQVTFATATWRINFLTYWIKIH